jgi:hypothetical protein
MPDSHRLPCYALAGTQDAITLTQISTSPTLKCKDNVTSPFFQLLMLAQFMLLELRARMMLCIPHSSNSPGYRRTIKLRRLQLLRSLSA